MKKIFSVVLATITLTLLLPTAVYASGDSATISSSLYVNGYYIETVIADATPDGLLPMVTNASNTVTKTKTTYIKDANKNTLWYVSVTATFSYDGNKSECTSCSHHAGSNASSWSIKSCSSNKSGNTATATATALHTNIFGISQEYTQSVTIQCSPSGEVY